jgi:hypothetical protein
LSTLTQGDYSLDDLLTEADDEAFGDETFDELFGSNWNTSDVTQPRYNLVKKGMGPESKRKSPDRHDRYKYEKSSLAYGRLRLLGFPRINVPELVHIGNILENFLRRHGIALTPRNRAARRRKPNAFHWIDENWASIPRRLYDHALMAVLCDKPERVKAMNEKTD